MKHFPSYIRVPTSDDMGKNLTLEEFRADQHAQSPLGKLFLELLAENTWSAGMSVQIHFHDSMKYTICFYSNFFPRYHGDHSGHVGFENYVPTMAEVKKLIMDTLAIESAGATSMITTLKHRAEEVSSTIWTVKRGFAMDALRTKIGDIVSKPAEKMGTPSLLVFESDDHRRCFFVKESDIVENPVPVYEVVDQTYRDFTHSVVLGTPTDGKEAVARGKRL